MREVLIVDDNAPFAENLAEILVDAGVGAEVARGGREALEKVARQQYDLLLSDMKMPAMGGAELVHHARRIDAGLPAVVITAYTNDDDLGVARREGLLAVLPKPAPIARLLDLVSSARRDGLVAIVEDDLAFSDNLVEALRTRGFAAVTAASLLETERLAGVRPFAAIADLRIPGGADGDALRALQRIFPGLPVLVASAFVTSVPPGVHAVFEKPFDLSGLMTMLERLHAERHAP